MDKGTGRASVDVKASAPLLLQEQLTNPVWSVAGYNAPPALQRAQAQRARGVGDDPKQVDTIRLIFGPNTPPSVIDQGFEAEQFDHGEVDVRPGSDNLDFRTLQTPLTALQRSLSICGVLCGGFGLLYLTLVREGQVALVQHLDGKMRVLQSGYHLLDTVWTSVRKFNLSQDLIEYGLVRIIRVLPGNVGLCSLNGKPLVLLQGRHLFIDPLLQFLGSKSLTEPHIQVETLHIITVQNDEIGLASVASSGHLLGSGRHIFNNSAFTFKGFRSATDEHIEIHSKHRVFVRQGQLGQVVVDGTGMLLEPGTHNFDCPRFEYLGPAPATTPHIAVGSLHRIFLTAGQVACYTNEGEGYILEQPGIRVFQSPTFEFKDIKPSTKEFLRVGSASRIIVPSGAVGKLTVDGGARLLDPGTYRFSEQNLTYDGSVSSVSPLIVHGHLKVVLVPQGCWGISYDGGAMVILKPGRHVLEKPSQSYAGELTAGMTVLSIKDVLAMTADNVALKCTAALSVRIDDPQKAVTMLCRGSFDLSILLETIRRKADLVLNGSIGMHRWNQAFSATSRKAVPQGGAEKLTSDAELDTPMAMVASHDPRISSSAASVLSSPGAGAARGMKNEPADDPQRPGEDEPGSFRGQIHSVFMAEFSTMMLSSCGVDILGMTIEDVQLQDPELAKQMAKGAAARAQLVANKVENEGMQNRASATAAAAKIAAQGEAGALLINAQAEANATIVRAEAEARATQLRAAAEASRISQINAAFASASEAMMRKEWLDSAGGILRAMDSSGTRVIIGADPVAALMGVLANAGGSSALTAALGGGINK